ncbi:MAG: GNAT family N-acetyltransferase [Pseudomonas gingeri]
MQRITSRLVLRSPKAEDLARLFAIYGDPATNQFNPAGPLSNSHQATSLLEDWLNDWETKGYGQWAIATRDSADQVIGFGGITLHKYNDVERLNLGYRFDVTSWGKGYATELGRASLEYGFGELGLDHIWALVRPAHFASIHVLEKIGMLRVDVLDDVPGKPPSLVYRISRS